MSEVEWGSAVLSACIESRPKIVTPDSAGTGGATRAEIIPAFDVEGDRVIGTIDVESEEINAFNQDMQDPLGACSVVIQPLWQL
jgi:putative methionine-R-sulfoxide reductase with GAF domain